MTHRSDPINPLPQIFQFPLAGEKKSKCTERFSQNEEDIFLKYPTRGGDLCARSFSRCAPARFFVLVFCPTRLGLISLAPWSSSSSLREISKVRPWRRQKLLFLIMNARRVLPAGSLSSLLALRPKKKGPCYKAVLSWTGGLGRFPRMGFEIFFFLPRCAR